ncbi:DUF2059 domain-containing protein [Parvularcula lutaonensis]|uniref:DUF2059 domain-containing protein n=1 Tax=Parvularcula lutaonensis TaxID=491923 RepID=A0ABV7MF18_9PROT|nr:DUF2059 domain-containing protein [Parvularcula lutaonensis]GGY52356.1 hypothetical protein GCM10007148_21810 [Parvularcula lutaonensis]
MPSRIIAAGFGLLSFVVSSVTSEAIASENAQPADSYRERREAAEQYVNSPMMQKQFDQMLAPGGMLEQVVAAVSLGDMPPEFKALVIELALDEFRAFRPQLEEALIEASAQTYTVAELNAAAAFYDSPEGRSIIEKAPQMQAAYLKLYEPVITNYMDAVQKRAKDFASEIQKQER